MKALRIIGWSLGALITLPVTVFGLLLFIIVYRAHSWRFENGCITCVAGRFERTNKKTGKRESVTRIWGRPGAQTWGIAIAFSRESNRKSQRLNVHERIHVIQSFVVPYIYLLAYGIQFLLMFFFFVPKRPHPKVAHLFSKEAPNRYEDEPRWRRAYVWLCWEIQAYHLDREFSLGKRPGSWGSTAIAA